MADNTVKVTIDGKDDTGGAFASAMSREKAFAAISDATSQKELANAARSERALRTREDAFARVTRAMHFMNQEAEKAVRIQGDLDRALSGSGGGFFSRLLHRGGGFSGLWGLAGAGQGGGGLGAAGPVGIGALIAWAASLVPAAVPFGAGGLVAGGGALGALKIANSWQTQMFSQRALLNSIMTLQQSTKPLTAAQERTLSLDLAKYHSGIPVGQLRALGAPLRKYQSTFQDLGLTAQSVFTRALTSGGHGSFLSGMTGILKQISGFVKSIGPELGNLFRSSLPFASAFVKIMERFGRIILPVVTQMLNQMAPYLPQMVKGFVLLAQGLAGFLRNLGPGMKDSAIIFEASMMVMKGVLQLLGWAFAHLAILIVKAAEGIRAFARNLPRWFDDARHAVASFAHDVAHYFDEARHTVATWGHDLAATFDRARHDVATWIGNVATWFGQLPGKIMGFLAKLPSMLYQAGKNAIQGLINGLGSMLGSLGSMASSIASKIAGFFGLSPAREGPLSGSGAPFIRGQHFAADLAAGMNGQLSSVAAAASRTAAAMIPHGGHTPLSGPAAGGGVLRVQLELVTTDGQIMTAIANNIRVRGGDPRILTTKVSALV